jgi:predicted ATPase/DNA-binding CsgD family transcriptional regulator
MSNPSGNPVQLLIEPLTRREREVLALLARGYSAPEIAENLTLAVSSVKWHLQRLYGKLGVNSKRQALNRAKALGLLEPGATPAVPDQPGPKHNLPVPVTRFFGREAEILQLKERLAEHRLVTLIGSGGVGKTRLSLRAAEEVAGDFANGVWFASFAPLSDPALVAQQVAGSLGLRDEPGLAALDSLTNFLRQRQALLVLDNCEHLLEACALLANALLIACPRVRLLASSREPLGCAGEAVIVVPSLPFPEQTQTIIDLERLGGYAALALFTDRARLVFPTYQLTPHNVSAVTRVCRRLDGIPLAIEMAAARMATLTADQLADRLDDAFRLLTSGNRTALARHQTLRGTIDWSYQLLTEAERLLLQRLSAFAGGWTLEAAEAVCSGAGLEPGAVMEVLTALVAKSMVISDRRQGEAARYRLLETVRQFAREKLETAGETASVRARHRDYFLDFAESGAEKFQGEERAVWAAKLSAEYDNFRQAMDWCFSDAGRVDAGPRIVSALFNAPWPSHRELLDWHHRARAWCRTRSDIHPQFHVGLLTSGAALVALNDPPAAEAWAVEAVAISRAMGPAGQQSLILSLFTLASGCLFDRGLPERAVAPLEEAEALWEALRPGDLTPEATLNGGAWFAHRRAELAIRQQRYLDAIPHATECIRLFVESGRPWTAAYGHMSWGEACLSLGKLQEARNQFQAAANLHRTVAMGTEDFAYSVRWLAATELAEGRLAQALDYCLESIAEADRVPDRNIIASNLGLMAIINAKQGHATRASRLAGASAAMWVKQKRKPWEDSSLDSILPGWRDGPDRDTIQAAYAAGQTMSGDEAVAYALGDQPV